jgi:hypothetical protein
MASPVPSPPQPPPLDSTPPFFLPFEGLPGLGGPDPFRPNQRSRLAGAR